MLYPHNLDLHSYRILLMAATGRTSEEVVALHEDDIEYGPRSVLIDFTKQRARTTRRSAYSTPAQKEDRVLHPSNPRLDVAEVTRSLLALARPLAERSATTPVPLFLRAAVSHHTMTVQSFRGTGSGLRLTDWLNIHNVRIDGPADIRRLRKSGKVEKALTFKGRISDIADDHTEETFRRSYAHGTTLRVIAGQVITTAQQHWLSKALAGPVVLDQEQSLQDPDAEAALGLSAQDIEQLRAGELDMASPVAATPSLPRSGARVRCARSPRPAAWNAAMRSSCRPTFLNFCCSPPIWNSCVTGSPRATFTLCGGRARPTSPKFSACVPAPRSPGRASASPTRA
ncbi:hypothetical protein [Streptomyces sp. NPDC002619]|uniref:hypothetical protein n=1 Tax=Streptomyces sp. NPDC002619 TaxID=3364655 RepID=UPI0036824873